MFQRNTQDGIARDGFAPSGGIGVTSGFAALEGRLRHLDKVLARLRRDRLRKKKPTPRQLDKLFEHVRATLELARFRAPELVGGLCQHLSVHGVLAELPAGELHQAFGQPPSHDAYFWRLLARAYENRRLPSLACLAWEQFRAHALDEGWFLLTDFRVAAIDLRMAGQLTALSARELDAIQAMAESSLDIILQFYRQQSERIRALAPSKSSNSIALNPDQLCDRAATSITIPRLAEMALDNAAPELAYRLLGNAFQAEDADLPRLLALRARSLPPWTPVRILECLHVAIELARRQHDQDLVSEILAASRQRRNMDSVTGLTAFLDSLSEIPLSEDELAAILKREREAIPYPASPDDDVTYPDDWDNEMDFDPMCLCAQCEKRRQISLASNEESCGEVGTWLDVDPAQSLSSLLSGDTVS